ncbi:hypothetical protein QZH56_15025 [Streptomyces olivoreticuli]|uniref:hypothetical protein n=1 Tax=Streptomyces olivoreticuli TaxID=68246 RepID=UPI0026581DD8|nr:hypothetical protein [Streptomyces olivoreticuli]WKK27795.1 hypothetical protein QZH56_15025 [Streptomyces olivoreticuli]
MKDFIARLFRRARAPFKPRTLNAPQPPAPPSADPEPQSTCGVYMWATAHGIDLKPSSPLADCRCSEHIREPVPEVGSYVVDVRTDRIGRVMGDAGPYLQLRPPAGGREWDVEPGDTRPATDSELLSAKVKVVNSGGRWGK